jgi:hypothetical protein
MTEFQSKFDPAAVNDALKVENQPYEDAEFGEIPTHGIEWRIGKNTVLRVDLDTYLVAIWHKNTRLHDMQGKIVHTNGIAFYAEDVEIHSTKKGKKVVMTLGKTSPEPGAIARIYPQGHVRIGHPVSKAEVQLSKAGFNSSDELTTLPRRSIENQSVVDPGYGNEGPEATA